MATQTCAARGVQTGTQLSYTNVSIAKAETQDVAPYSQALARLEPLQSVLAGLAHRNHNQHRHAAWWRCFGMLRRNCAKLVEDLVVAVAAARKYAARAAKAAKSKSKKRRREEEASGGPVTGMGGNDVLVVQGSQPEIRIVASHAAWLHDVLTPKCYLAFSQLTADNQFAPLGVVLLGILAQVKAACDCVVPRPADPPSSSPPASEIPETAERRLFSFGNPVAENGSTTAVPASELRLMASETQLAPEKKQESRREATVGSGGKAISREDVERAAEQRKRKDIQPTTVTNHTKAGNPTKTKISILSSEKQELSAQVDDDGDDARSAKKIKTAPVTKTKARDESNENDKTKKKKKKVKKGDEFDDLFKGLF